VPTFLFPREDNVDKLLAVHVLKKNYDRRQTINELSKKKLGFSDTGVHEIVFSFYRAETFGID
jgi:hypothetical protein